MPVSFPQKPGLVAYLTVGDPDLVTTRDMALAAIDAGAEVLELGVPFSDPLADGPVIQRASERSVARGTTLSDVLALAAHLRKARPDCGLVLFSYLNPVVRFGQMHATSTCTLAAAVEVEAQNIRQHSPISQYARIKVRFEPAPRGTGYQFTNRLEDGTFSASFVRATSRGIEGAMREGLLPGQSFTDVNVSLLQAVQHDIDSSDQSFQVAGARAFREALARVETTLLATTAGMDVFCKAAKESGLDGVLLTDMIVEEADSYLEAMRANELAPIFLAAPTSPDARLRAIGEASRGFVYAISRVGITGTRDTVASDAPELVRRLRAFTTLPIAVGFGISNAAHVRAVGEFADAAVVGSALVGLIEQTAPADAPAAVGKFIRDLRSA